MPNGRTTILAFLLIAALPAVCSAAEVTLVIDFPSISPDGDGVKDSLVADMILAGPVDTLVVTVEDQDTGAVFDTIFAMEGLEAGDYPAAWDGTDSTGSLLPEGAYTLKLFEYSAAEAHHQERTVIIDLTPPSIVLDRIEPGIFSPGFPSDTSRVYIYYIVSSYDTGTEGEISFTTPQSTVTSFALGIEGDGEGLFKWDPLEEFPSGIYAVELVITDPAGNSDSASGALQLDTDEPVIAIVTDLAMSTREPPPAIEGYCHDASGIRDGSLELRWGQFDASDTYYETGPFEPDDSWLSGDTLYWAFDLPDSVDGTTGYFENRYTLKASCYDIFDRFRMASVDFRVDRTPPAKPVIENMPGKVVVTPLELDLDYDAGVDSLYIYRWHDEEVTRTGILEQMPKTVDLGPGLNRIWVIARDMAGNFSEPSDTLDVEYSTEAGVDIPEVFRGPDDFQVVTSDPAMGIVVHIFDIGGNHVRRLDDWSGSTVFILEWDLRNDDGVVVRNGPYVLVMTIHHYDGSKTVQKEFIAVVK